MELRNLNALIHVAELGSFTKAADRLGYSQSTVSLQIKQLEAELGAQLLERINHTVVLTQRGRQVLTYAHHIMKMVQDMEEGESEGQEVRGHLRIAMAESLCNLLLDDDFHDFRSQYPAVTMKIIVAGTEEMFRLLNQNEVDLVYTLDNHIYNTEYVIAQEEKISMHFVAGRQCPLIGRGKISIKELVEQPFILTEKGMSYRRLMDEKLAAMSLEIKPILEIGNTELICRLAEGQAGISFLPDYVTKKAVSAGRLAYLNVPDFEIDVWKQAIYHRDKWLSPQMQAFLYHRKKRPVS